MYKTTIKTWQASFTLGSYRGYNTTDIIEEHELKEQLVKGQHEMYDKHKILLSTRLTRCAIIADAQDETSFTLEFINYPKFPADETILKNAITDLAVLLMKRLSQNRTVIIFPDQTVMLESDREAADPGIITGKNIINHLKTNKL